MDYPYDSEHRIADGSSRAFLSMLRPVSRPRARLLVMAGSETARALHPQTAEEYPDIPTCSMQNMGGTTLRVLLVDDHTQLRQGLRGLVEGFPGMEVVGEAGDGEQAVLLAQELHPDLILMDVQLPRMNGYDATRRICAQKSAHAVIGLSVGHIQSVEAGMLAAGAQAYLCKEDAADHLYDMIRAIFPKHSQPILS